MCIIPFENVTKMLRKTFFTKIHLSIDKMEDTNIIAKGTKKALILYGA